MTEGLTVRQLAQKPCLDHGLCSLCVGGRNRIQGGLVISATSLDDGLVHFMGNAAFDLTSLKEKAEPLETLQEGKRNLNR